MGALPQYRLKAILELVMLLPSGDALVQNAGDSSNQWIISASIWTMNYEAIV